MRSYVFIFKGVLSISHSRMKDFKRFKFYRVGKVPSFPLIPHLLSNSENNIKRKEMKNNYSPRDNKYTFSRLLHALHT